MAVQVQKLKSVNRNMIKAQKWDSGWVWLGDCNDRGSWMQILFNRAKKVNEIITANVVVPG